MRPPRPTSRRQWRQALPYCSLCGRPAVELRFIPELKATRRERFLRVANPEADARDEREAIAPGSKVGNNIKEIWYWRPLSPWRSPRRRIVGATSDRENVAFPVAAYSLTIRGPR